MDRPTARTVAAVVLALLLVPTVAWAVVRAPHLAAPGDAGPPGPMGTHDSLDPSQVAVSVSPGDWTLYPGADIALAAAAANLPDGCSVFAQWFQWSLSGSSFARGFLNVTSGPSVEVTALPNASGAMEVQVDATFALVCDDGSSADVSPVGSAEVRILPGLAVSAVHADPDPTAPGRWTTLAWTVAGGAPPYTVAVDFGDGNLSTIVQSSPGNDDVEHLYDAGEFGPGLTVTDARGTSVRAEVGTPVLSAPGLSVALRGTAGVAEAGRPFVVNASVAGGWGPISALWWLNGTPVAGAAGPPPSTAFTPAAAGTVLVGVELVDGFGQAAFANLTVDVAPALQLSLDPLVVGAEVDRPVLLHGNLSGGVGPIVVRWAPVGNGSAPTSDGEPDGPFLAPVIPGTPGDLWVQVVATDALGANAGGTFDVGTVGLPPVVVLGAPDGTPEAGVPLAMSLRLAGGVGPFAWVVRSDPGLAGAALPSGTLAAAGAAAWNGTPGGGGNLTLQAVVVDRYGAVAEANLSLAVLPPLDVAVAFDNTTDPGSVTVYLRIAGGEGPYAVRASLGGRGASAFNVSASVGLELRLDGPVAGFDTLEVTVEDALGVVTTAATGVFVPVAEVAGSPGTDPGGSPPDPGVPVGVTVATTLLAAGGVAAAFWAIRRRDRSGGDATPPGARALELVRRSLQGPSGIDLETLRFLAAEEGLPGEAVDGALERWRRIGRVATAPGPLGEEEYRWTVPEAHDATPDEPGAELP